MTARDGTAKPDGAALEGTALDAPVSVTVLFFASARDATGVPRAGFDLPSGSTLADLAELLEAHYGVPLSDVMATCALWVNSFPAPPGYELRQGDEVAVLPPVSGGCGPVSE